MPGARRYPIKHKFGARVTERNGLKFHSKKEAEYYDRLVLSQKAGTVLFFLMQVPFHLPGNVKYIVDFQVFMADGSVHFIDVKGHSTAQYISKKKMVEALYPVEIEER